MASMTDYNWPAMRPAEDRALGERYAEEIAVNFDPASQVRAMDKEGLDLLCCTQLQPCTSPPRMAWTLALLKQPAELTTTGSMITFRKLAHPVSSTSYRL